MEKHNCLKTAILLAGIFIQAVVGAETELDIAGKFQAPSKPDLPPLKWNRKSDSKGTLEYLQDGASGSVVMASEQGGRMGIYSPAVGAKAGDIIRVEATVHAEEISVCLFQYAKGASSQTQQVKASKEGCRITCTFTVTDVEGKGPTQAIRVCFQTPKGQQATITDAKAYRQEQVTE
ncbi:MAG: hypothetical protein IJJ33_09305 [Victivallales bacterium]|nr:hypothetical protein [Victivallales bacterium]